MIRTALLILLTLAIAICGGAASVAFVMERDIKLGAARVGSWTAYPDSGSATADPYALAEAAVEGTLALGRSEGLSFSAQSDDKGNSLRAECIYRLAGETPLARFWTLRSEPYEYIAAIRVVTAPAHGTLQSRSVIRGEDNNIEITIGPKPAPGNWLRTEGEGRTRLVLTVYDSLVQGGPMAETMQMPSITQVSCNG
ncbi:MAG: DUF1214 domain-containing protein [Mesorhizobium sp.]